MAVPGLCNEVEFCLKLGMGYLAWSDGLQSFSIGAGQPPSLNLKRYCSLASAVWLSLSFITPGPVEAIVFIVLI